VRLKEPAYLYVVLQTVGMPQCMPVRPIWGGLKRRAVRRLEELSYFVSHDARGAHAAAHASTPCMGKPEVARGAP